MQVHSTRHDAQVAHGKALETIAPSLAAAVEDGAAAAAPEIDSTEDKVIVKFNVAYQCRNNKNGTLQSRTFAFGNNKGTRPAPPSIR